MIVVTGGLGFIGSILIEELNKMGEYDILIVDRFRDKGKWLNVRDLKYEDVLDPEVFVSAEAAEIYEDISCIYHLGACNTTTESDMDFLWKNNVQFSKVLFDMATQFDVRVCYASSASTYGAGEKGYDDSIDLLPFLRPLHQYGYSKQVFDEWVLAHEQGPSVWAGLKFFNVYGPHEYHKEKMLSMQYQAFQQIQNTGKVKLFKSYRHDFADGEQKRDFIYVRDVARAMIELMKKLRPKDSGVFNLGSGKARSWNDLANAAFKTLDKPASIDYIDMPESLRNQYQYFTQAKMDRFKKVLPNFKFMDLEEGIADYYHNYLLKDHPYASFEG